MMFMFPENTCVLFWAVLLCVSGEDVFMESQPLHCIPNMEVVHDTPSEIICAMISHRSHAPMYSFSQGVCSMRAVGQSQVSQKSEFLPFSPPNFTQVANVALGKPIEASLKYSTSYLPQYGNDGSTSTVSINHSSDKLPWWMVDLQQIHLVDRVEVLPRQASWYYRFHKIEVRVGSQPRNGVDFSAWPLLGKYEGPYTLAEGTIVFSNETKLCGRYVVIQRVNPVANYLEIADAKVFVHLP